MSEKNSKGKKRKWEPVELDDPSFYAGELDGFMSLEVMELSSRRASRNWCRWTSSEEENKRMAAVGGELLKVL